MDSVSKPTRVTSNILHLTQDHEDVGHEQAGGDHARPQTRKELDDLKGNFSNKLVMAYHYHQDPMLPLEFKAMFWASRPLLHEYEATLDIQKDGQDIFWK